MAKVTIYTTPLCPYCQIAKQLLHRKGAVFDEIDVLRRPALRDEMRARAGGRSTVPQIWIGDSHVGGCNELYELEATGRLDAMLAA